MGSIVPRIFILISLIQGAISEDQNYTCEISDDICILQNLHLTASDKNFRLDPNKAITEINDVWIRTSKIEVLTDAFCQTLPYVKVFDGSKIGVSFVEENAFAKCTKLETIDLSMNALTSLPPKTFFWNGELKYLYLWNNKLTEINENFFNYNLKLIKIALNGNVLKTLSANLFKDLVDLKTLWLQGNQICDLSFLEELPTMKSLTEIRLDFNKLADIDLPMLYKKLPNLKEINLNENQFWCGRVTKISESLSKKGVTNNAMSGCIQEKDEWMTMKKKREIQRKKDQEESRSASEKTMSTKDEL